ncbi:MAG: glycosyltransferase family 9 protein [Candidatus Muiribacteriaceae bacterium]
MRILVVLPDRLSYILASEPAVESIRNRYKSSEIIALSNERFSDIPARWDFVDDLAVYKDKASFCSRFSLMLMLHRFRSDLVFFLGGAFPDFLHRILLTGKKIVPDYTFPTIRESHIDVFISNDIDYIDRYPLWYFPPGFKYRIGRVKAPLLTLSPFSAGFPIERYLYIMAEYNRRFGGSVIITGNVDNYEKSMAFDHFDFVFNQVGKTNPDSLAFIYRHSTVCMISDRDSAVLCSSVNKDFLYIEETGKYNPFCFLENHWPMKDHEILEILSEITESKNLC